MKSSMEAKLVALSDYTPYGEMAEELLIWTVRKHLVDDPVWFTDGAERLGAGGSDRDGARCEQKDQGPGVHGVSIRLAIKGGDATAAPADPLPARRRAARRPRRAAN